MALGMMIPGMAAGWLQETMGYQLFFIWIMACTLATFGVTALLKWDDKE
jgi:PAT family beta-lactamase induction signal transducer AmpG